MRLGMQMRNQARWSHIYALPLGFLSIGAYLLTRLMVWSGDATPRFFCIGLA